MVENTLPEVTWNKRAYASLQKAYETIKEDSAINAAKVREDILAITKGLPKNPGRYPPDKFKKNNPGNYRAFEKHAYRVAYKHTKREIRILRIRHAKQEPKKY